MNTNIKSNIEKYLSDVSPGQILLKNVDPDKINRPIELGKFSLYDNTSKGLIECYSLFPGVYFNYMTFLGISSLSYKNHYVPQYNFIYSVDGSLLWEQENAKTITIDSSTFVYYPQASSSTTFFLSENYYANCVLDIEPHIFTQNLPPWLKEMSFSTNQFEELFTNTQPNFILSPKGIASLFNKALLIPIEQRPIYLKLLVQELLWQISQLHSAKSSNLIYGDEKIECMREVKQYLIRNVSTHITIKQLALIFHIDVSTLQRDFKEVFGTIIGAFMMNYRLSLAQSYLMSSTLSVAKIAAACGYSNTSSFSALFKKAIGQSPSEFRACPNLKMPVNLKEIDPL